MKKRFLALTLALAMTSALLAGPRQSGLVAIDKITTSSGAMAA